VGAPAPGDSTHAAPSSADTLHTAPPAPASADTLQSAPVDSSGIGIGAGATAHPDSTAAPLIDLGIPSLGGGSGPVVHSIRASGFANVDSSVIVRTFGVHVGQPYTRDAVREGVRRLFQSGLYTDVNVVDTPAANGVDLNIIVAERARIHAIKFQGIHKIEEKTLKEKVTSAQGQLLDPGTTELDTGKLTVEGSVTLEERQIIERRLLEVPLKGHLDFGEGLPLCAEARVPYSITTPPASPVAR